MRKPRIKNEHYVKTATLLCVLFECPVRAYRFVRRHPWYVTIVAAIVSVISFAETIRSIDSTSRLSGFCLVTAILTLLVAMDKPSSWYIEHQPSDKLLGAKEVTN